MLPLFLAHFFMDCFPLYCQGQPPSVPPCEPIVEQDLEPDQHNKLVMEHMLQLPGLTSEMIVQVFLCFGHLNILLSFFYSFVLCVIFISFVLVHPRKEV